MDLICPDTGFWVFAGCNDLKYISLYFAVVTVVAFHKTAGIFERVRMEHQADYARGSHAIFHIEKQGMLATCRAQRLWILAAVVVSFLQGYINAFFLNQCWIWMSGKSSWEDSEIDESLPLLKTYDRSNNRDALI